MSVLDDALKFLLPTKLTQWTAGLTIALAVTAAGLPDLLRRLGYTVSDQEEWLLRITAITSTAFLGTLVVLLLVLRHYHSLEPRTTSANNHRDVNPISDSENLFHKVLTLIAEYCSQNIPATPRRIAESLGVDPVQLHLDMLKYHNAQFITFMNNGKPPEMDTPFILSPSAWQHIKIVKA